MLSKNFLRPGPNDIDYYDNDPLHLDFLAVFAKSSYYTTTWKKRLKIPRDHRGQYTLDWRGPLHLSTSPAALEALLQQHVDDYTEWAVPAFYVLNDLKVKKYDDWSYSHRQAAPHFCFDALRNALLYDLIQQEELYIYSYDTFKYLSRIKYHAKGHYSEYKGNGYGIGLVSFNAGGYRIVDKVQWSYLE